MTVRKVSFDRFGSSKESPARIDEYAFELALDRFVEPAFIRYLHITYGVYDIARDGNDTPHNATISASTRAAFARRIVRTREDCNTAENDVGSRSTLEYLQGVWTIKRVFQ